MRLSDFIGDFWKTKRAVNIENQLLQLAILALEDEVISTGKFREIYRIVFDERCPIGDEHEIIRALLPQLHDWRMKHCEEIIAESRDAAARIFREVAMAKDSRDASKGVSQGGDLHGHRTNTEGAVTTTHEHDQLCGAIETEPHSPEQE